MLLIPQLLPRTEQPQDGARIDPSHPLAGRIVAAYLPAISASNLARGPGVLGSHAAPTVALPQSMLATSITATNLRITSDRSFGPTPSYPLTMVWIGQQGSTANTQIAGITSAGGIGGSYYYIGGGSSTLIGFSARNNYGSALAMLAAVPGGSALGVELVVVVQSLSANNHRVSINGSAVATDATNIGAMVAWDRVYMGQSASANNQATAFFAVASGGAPLTDEQMQQLSRDPRAVYALFEPQRIWVPINATSGGGQTVAIAQASEADTAQAFSATVGSVTAIGQALEANAAQALTTRQTKAIGQAVEADAAQALAAAQRKVLGQAAETDTAQAFATVQRKAVGQAIETDSAQPIAYSAPGTIGQVLETDAAQPIVAKQVRAIGQVSETEFAQPITAGTGIAVAIGMALEIDTAGAFVAPLLVAIGQALEVDAARAMTSIGGDVSIDPATIRRVARSPALARLARSPAMVRSTNGL